MSEPITDRELFDALANVNRKLRVLFDARVKETGLTLSRARVLFTLLRRNGLNQRELAEELGIETPTIVRLLDGMEKQDFVERRLEASDRRTKRIHLTAHGRQSAEEIEEVARKIRVEVLEGIDPEEKRVTLKVVNTVIDNILQRIGKE
ncbi:MULTISPECIES: MarR family transcriptional regulator [unclassified Rhizobium]|uniref:MarR family winged helix-turn-helix transcriptional regulator n=1 Tax=unclassified Rhizobium TaxID=2613769 RepID=UPI0006FCC80F|nr:MULTISPECIES: MarR family transcriptional regulator [unclassified Rhizobium]KQV43410.1 MarR family transcriptional regulator [Rhizobium sp. Root1212]KRD37595.1 MarR family transcriptional regulator [Rhizobium sp. Root268]